MWAESYVGLPFGEGAGEVTCWSLVVRVYADQLGISLPAYGEISAHDLRRVAVTMGREQLGEHWRAVQPPQAFDVAIMRSGRGGSLIKHVGVMVDEHRLLHVEEATASVIVPISNFTVRARIAGFRRYVS